MHNKQTKTQRLENAGGIITALFFLAGGFFMLWHICTWAERGFMIVKQ